MSGNYPMSYLDDLLSDILPTPIKQYFGDVVTYKHASNSTTQSITAVFSDPIPSESIFPGANTIAEVVVADLTIAPVRNDEIHYGGVEYLVFDLRVDEIGFALLGLKRKN